jgi:hypothetical protein
MMTPLQDLLRSVMCMRLLSEDDADRAAEICSGIRDLAAENARLREALKLQHFALTNIGSMIQNDNCHWKIRKPHSQMPDVFSQINAALRAYHDATGLAGEA